MDFSRLLQNNAVGEPPELFNNSQESTTWLLKELDHHDPISFTRMYCPLHHQWEAIVGSRGEQFIISSLSWIRYMVQHMPFLNLDPSLWSQIPLPCDTGASQSGYALFHHGPSLRFLVASSLGKPVKFKILKRSGL